MSKKKRAPHKEHRERGVYKGVYWDVEADSAKELAEKIRLKLSEIDNTERVNKTDITVTAWFEQWVNTYMSNTSREYQKDIERFIEKRISPRIGKWRIRDVYEIDLQEIVNDMYGLSESYVNKGMRWIKDAFRRAKKNKLILYNPAEDLEKPKYVKKDNARRNITMYERYHVIKVAMDHRAKFWVLFQLWAGMRPGEAGAVQNRHIDLKRRRIDISEAIKRDDTIGGPKTEAGKRYAPIIDALAVELEKVYDPSRPYDYICTNAHGGRLTKSSARVLWEDFERALNISMGCETTYNKYSGQTLPLPPFRVANDLTPYCFRHTFCTDMAEAGVPIKDMSGAMGHTKPETTQRYRHDKAKINNVTDLLNAYHKTLKIPVKGPHLKNSLYKKSPSLIQNPDSILA